MPSLATKRARKAQKEHRLIGSMKDMEIGSTSAILSSQAEAKRAKQHAARMEQVKDAAEHCNGGDSPDDQGFSTNHDAITRPILEAINVSKAELIGRIDHLSSECPIIRHDLDKIRGRLTKVEDRVSEVDDTSHSYDTHLSEMRDRVRSLQHRADDAEDRQRRNTIPVVGLPEGSEGAKPVAFAEQFFKQLLSLQDLPPTYVWEDAQGPHRHPSPWYFPKALPG